MEVEVAAPSPRLVSLAKTSAVLEAREDISEARISKIRTLTRPRLGGKVVVRFLGEFGGAVAMD